MRSEQRGCVIQQRTKVNHFKWEELNDQAKPYSISKKSVAKAFELVKANRGAAGVDGESIEAFELKLKDNLYKIWNRMSSGSYFPPPVRAVGIPKKDGTTRLLGIPTVADRVAQMVVKMHLDDHGGTALSPQFIRLSTGKIGSPGVGSYPHKVLALRLGYRP